jgi:hypothetical protein
LSRDKLQAQALRLYDEHVRLLKKAKASGMPERAILQQQADIVARDAKIAVEKFYKASMREYA